LLLLLSLPQVVRSHRKITRTLADLQHLTLDVSEIPAAGVTDASTGFVDVKALGKAWRTKQAAKEAAMDRSLKKLQFQLHQARADAAQQLATSSRRITELQDRIAVAAQVHDEETNAAVAEATATATAAAAAATAAAAAASSAQDTTSASSTAPPRSPSSPPPPSAGTGTSTDTGTSTGAETAQQDPPRAAGEGEGVGIAGASGGGGGAEVVHLRRTVRELRVDLQLQKKWAAERATAWEEQVESLRQVAEENERRVVALQRAAQADQVALAASKEHLEEERARLRSVQAEVCGLCVVL